MKTHHLNDTTEHPKYHRMMANPDKVLVYSNKYINPGDEIVFPDGETRIIEKRVQETIAEITIRRHTSMNANTLFYEMVLRKEVL